jgi:hypothetical protein
LNGLNQGVINGDEVNILGENINTKDSNAEMLLKCSKETGAEVHLDNIRLSI